MTADDEYQSKILEEAFNEAIKKRLKARAIEAIEPELDKAVEDVFNEMKVHARKYFDVRVGTQFVEFLLTDNREKKK